MSEIIHIDKRIECQLLLWCLKQFYELNCRLLRSKPNWTIDRTILRFVDFYSISICREWRMPGNLSRKYAIWCENWKKKKKTSNSKNDGRLSVPVITQASAILQFYSQLSWFLLCIEFHATHICMGFNCYIFNINNVYLNIKITQLKVCSSLTSHFTRFNWNQLNER